MPYDSMSSFHAEHVSTYACNYPRVLDCVTDELIRMRSISNLIAHSHDFQGFSLKTSPKILFLMCSSDAGNLQEKKETNRGKQFGGLTIDQRTLRWSCGLLYVNVLQKTANDL